MMYPGLVQTAPIATTRLSAPSGQVTNTAPTTRAAMALSVRPGKWTLDRIWGSLPTEDVEGHTPDPAYDVRAIEGLGWAHVRSERRGRGLGLSRDLDSVQTAQDRAVGRPSALVQAASTPSSPSSVLASAPPLSFLGTLSPGALAVVAAALLLLMKRR
jgi:hypothetical protein